MVRSSLTPAALSDPETAKSVQEVLKINRETLKKVEKPFWSSKKFIGFAISVAILFTMFMYSISALIAAPSLGWPLATVLLAVVFGVIFVAVAFNLSQAKVDSLNRGFAMLGGFADKVPMLKPKKEG